MAQDYNHKRTGAFFDAGGAGYNVCNPLFGAVGDGATDDRAAFALCDATPGPCFFPNRVHDDPANDEPGIYVFDSNITLTNSWRPVAGAMLQPASGIVITIDGAFEADAVQCFDESQGGSVVLGSNAKVSEIKPEWWGLPRIGTFADGDATPSVARGHLFQTANTAATVITNLDGGFDGQRVLIKLDANTTVQHNADIVLAVGSDISAAANKILALVRMGGVWYQEGFSSSISGGGNPPGGSGTAYFQDWSLVTTGAHAPDIAKFESFLDASNENWEFRVRASVDPETSGKVLQNEGSGGASRSCVFTQVPPTPTADVLVKVRAEAMHSANGGMGCMVRMSVDSDGVSVNGWGARLHGAVVGGARVFSLWKYVHGAVTTFPELDASADWANATWMYIRLHIDSLSVKARYWADGDPEPTIWQVEAQHDTELQTGWVGVYADQPSVAFEKFAFISVETNGGFAPMTGTPVAVTIPTPAITTPAHGPFDFESETLGNQPAGWTERGNTANVNWLAADDAGNMVINSVKTAGGASYLDLDAMSDAATTQEILAKMRQSALAANGSGLAVRINNDGRAYCLEMNTAQISIVEFSAGTPPVFVGTLVAATMILTAATWYWLRFRIEGTRMLIKAWEIDEPEPKSYFREITDATIAAGSAGLYHFPNNTTEYDDVSIATA